MRWPIRLEIMYAERLSSWLRRIGIYYGLTIEDLLKDLGFEGLKANQIDIRAPGLLAKEIRERTGLSLEVIRTTTISGLLSASLLRDTAVARAQYRDISVLSRPYRLQSRRRWIRWIRREGQSRIHACRLCLDEYPNASLLLPWALSIVFSCPTHEVLLEPVEVRRKQLIWQNEGSEKAPELIMQLDRRTWSALCEGYVRLPGGIIGDEHWFRVLQTIFHELEAPGLSDMKWQQIIRQEAGFLARAPGENFIFDIREAKLIATAIDQIEKGRVEAMGKDGHWFMSKASLAAEQRE